MSQKLTDRISQLEKKIIALETKIIDLASKTEKARKKPESQVAQLDMGRVTPLPSTGTGLGRIHGRMGNVIWNDSEANTPKWKNQPSTPTKGYNKHGHSRYAGGALDINTLELVEYEDLDISGYNKHCQSYWNIIPVIKKENGIEKIGNLDIEFDPSTGKWVAGARDIDVETVNLVQYEIDPITGEKNIKKDGNGEEMKTPLYPNNVVWDEDETTWKFYAVYSD